MIERILQEIREPEDYKTVMRLFEGDTANISEEEAEGILQVYKKYVREIEDEGTLRLFFAVDLLREKAVDKAGITEEEKELLMRSVDLETKMDLDVEGTLANKVKDMVENENARLPFRVLLARAALDRMAGAADFEQVKETVEVLASLLKGQEDQLLYLISVAVQEVRVKCRS